MSVHLPLWRAVEGYLLEAQARQLSPNTLHDYMHTFKRLARFIDGAAATLDAIERRTLIEFFAWLADEGWSKKSVINAHIALSSLWQWATVEGFTEKNIVRGIRPPKAEVKAVEPFSRDDIVALLKVCDQTQMCERNRAIILTLLDTCMRAGELCALLVADCDLRNRRVRIRHGKGGKERFVSFTAPTGRAIWRYLATRDDPQPGDPLFVTVRDRWMTTTGLAHSLWKLGKAAGVSNCHAHRFRHTGAIMHLANGMPAPVVQDMLGHSTLTMTRRYLNIANLDTARTHQRTSPVAVWRL